VVKKLGAFSELLCVRYIKQVLDGLVYLSEQGVIHRDIKAANILTNKDGTAKLADFGVAIKLQAGQKSNSVVGSPYWSMSTVLAVCRTGIPV
jgi:serine/threonine protein kinase